MLLSLGAGNAGSLGCLQGLTVSFLFVVLGTGDALTRMRDATAWVAFLMQVLGVGDALMRMRDQGGLMLVAPVSDCGTWLGGCAADMPGAGTDGAGEVKDGHVGLMGTLKAPLAGRAMT